jgi:hypothetical protein
VTRPVALEGAIGARRLRAAELLHAYLLRAHWDGRALVGPDYGIRINYRIGRFVKSYVPALARDHRLYYLQGQGYWTLGGLSIAERTGREEAREVALRCASTMLERQQPDGAWPYPNPEWKGRIATAEGTWGALGLLAAYRASSQTAFLEGALRWHRFVDGSIGFTEALGGRTVNYFAGSQEAVPNNTAFYLRFLAELAAATGDETMLERSGPLVTFVRAAQKATGELPYSVDIGSDRRRLEHYQCFQYNAFECLDLMRYRSLTGDDSVLEVIHGLLQFLRSGLRADGSVRYQCERPHPVVTYHTAVTAAAFAGGAEHEASEFEEDAARAYEWVVARQRPDGSFGHSERDYGHLRDRRAYPRSLAMILCHLLAGEARPGAARAPEDPEP